MRKNVWVDAYKHYMKGIATIVLMCMTFFLCVLYDLMTRPSITLDVLYGNWWIVVGIVFIPLVFWVGLNQLEKEGGSEFKITTLREIESKKVTFKMFEEKVVVTIESILKDCGLNFEKTRERKGWVTLTSFTIPSYGFIIEPRFSLAGMSKKEVNILIGPKTLENKEIVEKVKQKIDLFFT